MKGRLRRARQLAGVCVLWLICGMTGPTVADEHKSLTAIVLVAKITSGDPFFSDSVVLVLNNLGPAPVGIIVNRPTAIPVSQLFPDLKRLARLHDKVYFGGPVDFDDVWFLFRAAAPPEHAVRAFDGICISADRDLLLHLLGRDRPMEGLRIFVGHSGWGPGQLEAEIARGDWTLQHAAADVIFSGKSEHPWPGTPEPDNGT
ncbi:MAG TPA: YqgE/AlgH family protein [Steroidobacteraceae bacterium]|jgi:putative transcriptional regulator|nr:YqgE/AlgH family protein [Steroidobacteraceae bacterium]